MGSLTTANTSTLTVPRAAPSVANASMQPRQDGSQLMWRIEHVPGSGDVHVVPHLDLIEHNEQQRSCGCGPRLDDFAKPYQGEARVVVHNAADGREASELGRQVV